MGQKQYQQFFRACRWKAAAPSLPFLEVKPGTSAAGCCVQLCYPHLCLCNVNASWRLSCCQTLASCARWHIGIKNIMFSQYSVKKKTTMGKYDVLLSLYPSFNLSICNAYEGETNHSILKRTYPHRSSGAAWYWEAELIYSMPGFLFTWDCHSYFKCAVVFLSWGWSNIDQVAQQGSIISDLGDTQKLTGHDPKQLALVGPALSRELEYMTSRSAFLFTVVNDSTISWLYGWGVEWSHQNNFCCAVSYHLKPDHRRSVCWSLFYFSG